MRVNRDSCQARACLPLLSVREHRFRAYERFNVDIAAITGANKFSLSNIQVTVQFYAIVKRFIRLFQNLSLPCLETFAVLADRYRALVTV